MVLMVLVSDVMLCDWLVMVFFHLAYATGQ
ncbi:Uncharacterised protein [Klebsiella variicola]|uniref:Uncharacterized protein n=1 Tax=Klebsiella variicola TaxID=244366 RepID=A0A7H4MHN9_KLEVA|nr:Uncharacterised protein [Klebsiella variicola]